LALRLATDDHARGVGLQHGRAGLVAAASGRRQGTLSPARHLQRAYGFAGAPAERSTTAFLLLDPANKPGRNAGDVFEAISGLAARFSALRSLSCSRW